MDTTSNSSRGPEVVLIRQSLGRIAFIAACLGWLLPPAAHAADFLDPEDAFKLSAAVADGGKTVEAHFRIADGYYLYHERFAFAASDGVRFGAPQYPPGKIKVDEIFRKEVVTYRGDVTIRLPVQSGSGAFTLTATLQGCADRGLCYPPEQRHVRLLLNGATNEPAPSRSASVNGSAGFPGGAR
jgi:thiol:disulfide interchange protein DsbD